MIGRDIRSILKRVIMEFYERSYDLTLRDVQLPNHIKKTVTVVGARRVGKTYLLYQTMNQLMKEGVPHTCIVYINFEDERLLPFEKEYLNEILEAYYELFPEHINAKIFLFFDEIQEVPYWNRYIRRLQETGKYHIFITGSSSKLLSGEIATTLRGRTLGIELYPFSFGEYLRYRNFQITKKMEYSSKRFLIKKEFKNYLAFGGFPEIFDMEPEHKIQVLQEYFRMIFYRDMVDRYRLRNQTLMKDLLKYLMTNFASLFSVTAYYRVLKGMGRKISKDTIFEYVGLAEDINLIKLVRLYDFSSKVQMVNPRKVYPVDMGLITATSFQFTGNKGRYLETAVFLELLRRYKEIYYYRTKSGKEVDFITLLKNKPDQLIQVCHTMISGKTSDREISALFEAMDELGLKNAFILTNDSGIMIKKGKKTVHILSVSQWMSTRP